MSDHTPATLRNSANFYGVVQPSDDPWLNDHLAAWEADLAKLEAMERIRTEAMAVGAYFRYGPLLDALAAAQEEE